jgi:hypothetical protein
LYYNSKAFRNRNYLAWIRQQECIATGMDFTQTDMVAHHVRAGGNGGMGLKPSDYRTVPLTAFQHHKLHSMIETKYYEMFEVPIDDVIADLLQRYLRQKKNIKTLSNDFEELENLIEGA